MDSESLVGGLLSSGLGRLGFGAAKARPADHPLVILFVIGGISIDEVRKVRLAVREQEILVCQSGDACMVALGQVRHTISSFPGADGAPKVIVGGPSLLTPEDVLVHFFA